MERLKKSQIAKIFQDDGIDRKEILRSLKKELGIELDEGLSVEEQVDEVYRIYTETLDKLDEEGSKEYAPRTATGKIKLSKKEYIKELISKRKYTRAQLIEEANRYFEYNTENGSKGRVGRVIRELSHSGKLLELEGGILGIK